MTDHARLAADIVEGFERGEFESVWEQHAGEMGGRKSLPGLKMWWPTLDGMIGRSRRVTGSMQVGDSAGRAILSGESGEAVVTMLFDEAGKITDIGVTDWPLVLGIGNIQIDCLAGSVPAVAKLYAELLGIPLPPGEPNWVVLAKDRWTKPALPFAGQAPEWKPASWGDPDRPQQVHLELFVRDMSEAADIAAGNGATLVEEDVWIDQTGHAIRLIAGQRVDGRPAVIGRIVLDCFSPRSLAPFYEELLGMGMRGEDTPERVVIGYEDGRLPMLAFRHVPAHSPPRYPDPAYPQQMHMDLKFEDSHGARIVAERLGAIRLANPFGHPDVYADPAGHPFCLCFPGQ